MTKAAKDNFKRFAKMVIKKEMGITIPMNKMILLEAGEDKNGLLYFNGNKEQFIYYAMVEDTRTGKEYQATFYKYQFEAHEYKED